MMRYEEQAVRFECQGDWLYGVISVPEQPQGRGLLIVVGGPQYRAGSHRQFTLLARHLASCGIPVMRFDYRGMGDSEGDARDFQQIDDDLRSAIDYFILSVPGMTELAMWGLCDAASAALFYAHKDCRVTGLALLNPWVRTESGLARAYIKHYYLSRIIDRALWNKILSGRFNFVAATVSFLKLLRSALGKGEQSAASSVQVDSAVAVPKSPFSDRMLYGYLKFTGKVLLILSGNDLTAQEFTDLVASSAKWRKALDNGNTQRHDLAGANHTFSTGDWRNQVATWTKEWMKSW